MLKKYRQDISRGYFKNNNFPSKHNSAKNKWRIIYDILPPEKFKNTSKKILGIKNYKTKNFKLFALGWRSAVALFLILNVITGFGPISYINKIITALAEKDNLTVEFYPKNCQADSALETNSPGWINIKNLTEKPEVEEGGDLYSFNDSNSALYSGGTYGVRCGNFFNSEFMPEETENTEPAPEAPEQNINTLEVKAEPSDDMSTTTDSSNDASEFMPEETENTEPAPEKPEQNIGISEVKAEPPDDISTTTADNASSEQDLENTTPSQDTPIIGDEVSPEKTPDQQADDLPENAGDGLPVEIKFEDLENLVNDKQVEIMNNLTESRVPNQGESGGINEGQEDSNAEIKNSEKPVSGSGSIIKKFKKSLFVSEALAGDEITAGDEVKANREFKKAKIKLSLAVKKIEKTNEENSGGEDEDNNSDKTILTLWYSFNRPESSGSEGPWFELYKIPAKNLSNAINEGYLAIEAPEIRNWDDLDNLKVKLAGQTDNKDYEVYIDSVWTEVDYKKISGEETEAEKKDRWDSMLKFVSEKNDFKINDKWELRFNYSKNNKKLSDWLRFSDYWQDISLNAFIERENGEAVEVPLNIQYGGNGDLTIKLSKDVGAIKPGKYSIKLIFSDNSGGKEETIELSHDFTWGVLALNINKSVYKPADSAYLQMAVLDDAGNTLCGADLKLQITPPEGKTITLSTADGTIIKNSKCAPNNIINEPDYYANYVVSAAGEYSLKLTAQTANGLREITDSFEVRDSLPFEIERIGPTRIYPWSDYDMIFKIKANEDFSGDFYEYMPNDFSVVNQEVSIKTETDSDFVKLESDPAERDSIIFETENGVKRKAVWKNINIKKGDLLKIKYRFDAPNISPELYLLGPAKLTQADNASQIIFEERRQWQIASDANVGSLTAQAIGVTAGTIDTVNWTNVVTIPAGSFVAGGKYFIYLSSGFAASTNAATTDFEIVYGAASQFVGLIEPNSATAYDAAPIEWFDVYDQPATPVDVTLRYRTNAATSTVLNAEIMAINLSDLKTTDWAYAASTTLAQHTTSLVTKPSIRMTDADGTKDWLVFAMEEVVVDNAAVNFEGQIFSDSSGSMLRSYEGEDTLEILPYVIYRPFDDVAQNTTFSFRVRDDATGVNDHQKSRIFALNLDAFESHKTYYADVNIALVASTSGFSTVGGLNVGGNYAPQTTGEQIIFASVINTYTGTDDGTNNRLQVNSVTTPTSWSWAQSPILNQTNFDPTDQISQNIFTKISIPSTGQTIDLQANRYAGTAVTADEVSLAVFSVKKKNFYAPTGTFNSAALRTDSSGIVDISIEINDLDFDPIQAKLEYATGTDCLFSPSGDPTLDTTNGNITADSGDPDIDNASAYQIGTSTKILTTSGSNTVEFDWFSKTDVPTASGGYCLRLTANDGTVDQAVLATTTLTIDNVKPTSPGALSLNRRTGSSITLNYGATTTEDNFIEYKIFYKEYDGSEVTEIDTMYGSSTNPNLGIRDYGPTATTTISDLSPKIYYSFSIWAYDTFGNKASSSRADIVTNDRPTGSFNTGLTGQKTNGSGIVDISIEADDPNSDNTVRAKIDYIVGSDCDFSSPPDPIDPTIDEASITSDWGTPKVDNQFIYQVGTSTGWITTSNPGSNTVNFDWNSYIDVADADDTYCLRLTTNDVLDNQLSSATTTLTLDNVAPTAPGQLTDGGADSSSITLNFGLETEETNFKEYKIFYKEYDGFDVTEDDTPYVDTDLGDQYYNETLTTTIGSLTQNTQYVFNIWAYDDYGHKASSTQTALYTSMSIMNDSLVFTNPQSGNILVADGLTEWNFRATVESDNGWASISSTTLRLADNSDNLSPFEDLEFSWDQLSDTFSEIGNDVLGAASISANSSSSCADDTCTLDFKIVFNKNFTSSSVDYTAQLYSVDDTDYIDEDNYSDFYQARIARVKQIHYRWRNDNGGE